MILCKEEGKGVGKMWRGKFKWVCDIIEGIVVGMGGADVQ